MLSAIHHWPSLHCQAALVGFHTLVGSDFHHRHIEVYLNLIACLPASRNGGIAVNWGALHSIAVHLQLVFLAPTGYSHLDSLLCLVFQRYGGVPFPRIISLHCHAQVALAIFDCCIVADEEIYPQRILRCAVDVAAERRDEPAHIAWTACAAVPLLTMMIAVRLEGIDIEEFIALEADAGDYSIIHGTLHHVGIAALAGKLIHAVIPIYHAYRGTCLAVCRLVGQVVVGGEALVMSRRADAAGYIHIASYYIIPHRLERRQVACAWYVGCHISHTAEQIHRTHGMSGDAGIFPDGRMVLIINRIPGVVNGIVAAIAMPTLLEQPVGEVEIFLLPRHLVELHECQFYLLMARHPVAFALAKHTHHIVSHALPYIEQLTLARSLEVCHTGFQQVTGAVHLVLVHVCPALVESCQCVVCVQVAVALLGSGNFVGPFVNLCLEFGIGMIYQTVGIAFHCLVHIAVVEEDTRVFALATCGILVVLNAVGLVFYLIDTDGNCCFYVFLQLRRPERVVYPDVGEINLFNGFALCQTSLPTTGKQHRDE